MSAWCDDLTQIAVRRAVAVWGAEKVRSLGHGRIEADGRTYPHPAALIEAVHGLPLREEAHRRAAMVKLYGQIGPKELRVLHLLVSEPRLSTHGIEQRLFPGSPSGMHCSWVFHSCLPLERLGLVRRCGSRTGICWEVTPKGVELDAVGRR